MSRAFAPEAKALIGQMRSVSLVALGTKESLSRDFAGWAVSGKSDDDHRTAIATAAIKGSWFKRIERWQWWGLPRTA